MTMLAIPSVPPRAAPGAAPDTPAGHARPLSLLWAEVTGKCQLSCIHCYAGSGPDGTHGTMTPEAWETVLTDAAALGAQADCSRSGPRPSPPLTSRGPHAYTRRSPRQVKDELSRSDAVTRFLVPQRFLVQH